MKEQIKPQGDRFNEGRSKWSYVRFSALKPLVQILEFGATKYAPFNYTKGLSQVEICESLLRHVHAYLEGKDTDHESKLNILGHIQANAYFLEYNRLHHPELDDRFIEPFQKAENGTIEKNLEELKKYHYPEQQTEPTFLDMDYAKHRINNRFYKLIDELLERHVSNNEKKLEIGKLLKMRDNSLLELEKLRTKSNSGPREISKSELIDMAKEMRNENDCKKVDTRAMIPEQDKLYCLIFDKLWNYVVSSRDSTENNTLPKRLINTANSMYIEALDYTKAKRDTDQKIIELWESSKDSSYFKEKNDNSMKYLKDRLKKILFAFHNSNNLKFVFEQYQESIIDVIVEYINQYIESVKQLNSSETI